MKSCGSSLPDSRQQFWSLAFSWFCKRERKAFGVASLRHSHWLKSSSFSRLNKSERHTSSPWTARAAQVYGQLWGVRSVRVYVQCGAGAAFTPRHLESAAALNACITIIFLFIFSFSCKEVLFLLPELTCSGGPPHSSSPSVVCGGGGASSLSNFCRRKLQRKKSEKCKKEEKKKRKLKSGVAAQPGLACEGPLTWRCWLMAGCLLKRKKSEEN